MTEVVGEFLLDDDRSHKVDRFGSSVLEAASTYVAAALGKEQTDITVADIAHVFATEGFNEWPAELAADVRDTLATEHGYAHL